MLNNQTSKSAHFSILLLVIGAGFILQMAWLLASLRYLPLIGDGELYWTRSLTILHAYFSKLDKQGPLFPIFLALNRVLFPSHPMIMAKIEQLVLHALETVLIYFLAAKFSSRKAALVAGIIAYFYPELLSFEFILFSETLFLGFFLAGVLAYFHALEIDAGKKKYGYLALSGALNGIAALTRASNLYFLAFYLIHLFIFGRRGLKERVVAGLVFTLAMLAPVSVQTIKNYRLVGCFIPVDISPVRAQYMYHNFPEPIDHDFRGYWDMSPQDPCAGMNFCDQRKCATRRSIKFIAGHPGLSARHSVTKVLNLFAPNLYIYKVIFSADLQQYPGLKIYQGRWLRVIGSGSYLLLMLLAFLGMSLAKEWKLRSFTLFLICYYTAACMATLGASRYRMPIMPFMIIYAGNLLATTREELKAIPRWKLLLAMLVWLAFFGALFSRLVLVLK